MAIGYAVWLTSRSPVHKHLFLTDLNADRREIGREPAADRLRRAFGGQEEMFRDLQDKALGGKPMKSLPHSRHRQ